MVDLRRAVYSKEFEYDNLDGSKGTIRLLPLNMSYLPFLFSLTKKFKPDMTNEEIFAVLDDDTIKGITELCYATLKKSLPGTPEGDLNDFIVQHWSEMFSVIVELNTGKQKV